MNLRREIAKRIDETPYREVAALQNDVQLLAESVHTWMSLAREDRDWIKLGQEHDQINWAFIREVIKRARMFRLLNPIIKRAVLLRTFYTFGRGVEIRAQQPDGKPAAAANEYLQTFLKANRLLQPSGMSELDSFLQSDGNLFLCLHADSTGGEVSVRHIDSLEIADIITDPGDAEKPLYYLRQWSERSLTGATQEKKAYYPALGNEDRRTARLNGIEVMLEYRVIHMVEDRPMPRMLFGMPSYYAAMDPASDYRRFLAAWVTVQEALHRFALQAETKGGEKSVQSLTSRLHTTVGSDGGNDGNPPPTTGSAFVSGPGTKIAAFKSSGATDPPDEARVLFLFAIMSLGFPEHMYGDPATGNLATAKALDRPTELMILANQAKWKTTLDQIMQFALANQRTAAGGELRSEPGDVQIQVLVSFPPVLEHDIAQMVGAIVDAVTLKGQQFAGTFDPKTTLLFLAHVFGFKDAESLADNIFGSDYNPADWAPKTPEEREAAAQAMADRNVAQQEAMRRFSEALGNLIRKDTSVA